MDVHDLSLDDARTLSVGEEDEIDGGVSALRRRDVVSETIAAEHLGNEHVTRAPPRVLVERSDGALRWIEHGGFTLDSHRARLSSRRDDGVVFARLVNLVRKLVRTVHHVLHVHLLSLPSNVLHLV